MKTQLDLKTLKTVSGGTGGKVGIGVKASVSVGGKSHKGKGCGC